MNHILIFVLTWKGWRPFDDLRYLEWFECDDVILSSLPILPTSARTSRLLWFWGPHQTNISIHLNWVCAFLLCRIPSCSQPLIVGLFWYIMKFYHILQQESNLRMKPNTNQSPFYLQILVTSWSLTHPKAWLEAAPCWSHASCIPREASSACSSSTRWRGRRGTNWWFGSELMTARGLFAVSGRSTQSQVCMLFEYS